jgi:hypothetical protein
MAVDVLKYMSKSDIERMKYEDEILAEIDHEAEIDYVDIRDNNKYRLRTSALIINSYLQFIYSLSRKHSEMVFLRYSAIGLDYRV